MVELKKYKLNDFLESYGDGLHGTPNYSENGDYYFINGNNLENNRISINDTTPKLSESEYQKIKRPLKSNALLLSINGTLGKLAFYNNEKIALGKSACYLNIKPEVDRRYIKYVLSTKEFQKYMYTVASGSTIKNFAPKQAADYEFFAPNLPTQKKIADVLSCIDDKIALNNKTNTELENMAKTVYDYWFTQFDFPDKNGNPYKTSGGQMVYNETLKRDIPVGWEVKNILECCKVIDCLHSKKPDYYFEDEDCYLLQLDNLIDLKLIDLTNKYYVSKKDYETWTLKTKVKQGDLVVTNAGRVGGVSRIPNYIETGIGRNMTSIRPISISEYLLCYFFSSSDCDKQIRQNTDQGAFFQSLNVKGIKKLNLTIPPKEIQEKFDSLVSKIRLQIESNHKENEELTKLRAYLLPLLMNGQIKVK